VTHSFSPQLKVLPGAQLRLLSALAPAASLGLTLYGGTAVALRLGHRQSVDFDFFTERRLDRKELSDAFPFLSESQTIQDQPDTYTVLVRCSGDSHSSVKVSFFGDITFGRVGDPQWTDDGCLLVASLDDLMATKLKVILQRVEARDYRDIATMVNAEVSLARGLAAARELFGTAFQPSEALKTLVYFEGGDLATLSDTERRTLVKAVSAVHQLPQVNLVSKSLSDVAPFRGAQCRVMRT
jgi:nucleotidyltransferase AbiEii toxin of type IV toxin-antitoxin system